MDLKSRATDTHKIVITGASGFIGRQLVPRLKAAGHDLLLVGRDAEKLGRIFPGVPVSGYDALVEKSKDFDLLVHLAALNNNANGSEDEFNRVNIELFGDVVEKSGQAGIRRLLNVTSFHVFSHADSLYARSKRKALDVARSATGIDVLSVFLPAIYGDDFSGGLSAVGKLPATLVHPALTVLSAFTPIVHIDRLADFISNEAMHSGTGGDVFLTDSSSENPVYQGGRLLIDLLFVIAVFGFFWWLLIIVWVWIRADSRGGGIFAQQRIGRNGVPFTCYKFRTMRLGTGEHQTHEVAADAVTKIGSLLRKTKIDELPQAWNILRRELSLVGPRPSLPSQSRLIEERRKRGVLSVRPGITGLAQINGIDMRDPVELARWDTRYIAQQSLLTDIRIIFATLIGRGQGDQVKPES